MKKIDTKNAVGHVLCHDMTQIIPGKYKDARFRKGHVVSEDDIPILLSMGKESLYVWEMQPGMLHEDDAARRLCAICQNERMSASAPKEGKIELKAEQNGLFLVNAAKLNAINALDEIIIATRHSGPVKKGEKLCGARVIPLAVAEEKLSAAEKIAGETPILQLLPYKLKTAALVITGSEVKNGLIEDAFTPAIKNKLNVYGIDVIFETLPGDDTDSITKAISEATKYTPDLILCTGGMSVDPDDNTPGAIKSSGARIVTYGAPVLPGAMFLMGYLPDGTPIAGLPGCVMYAKTTIFDLVIPKIAAGIELKKEDFFLLGEGGLCLGCESCRFPNCSFGK